MTLQEAKEMGYIITGAKTKTPQLMKVCGASGKKGVVTYTVTDILSGIDEDHLITVDVRSAQPIEDIDEVAYTSSTGHEMIIKDEQTAMELYKDLLMRISIQYEAEISRIRDKQQEVESIIEAVDLIRVMSPVM